MREYQIPINSQKLESMLEEVYDHSGNIKNQEKYNFLNNMFVMMFGIEFKSIVDIVNKEHVEQYELNHKLLINEFSSKIEMKDREISLLKEIIEDLRTNYWKLKQSTLCRK